MRYEVQVSLLNGSANGQAARFDTIEECRQYAETVPNAEQYCILQRDNSKACGWSCHTEWIEVGVPKLFDAGKASGYPGRMVSIPEND